MTDAKPTILRCSELDRLFACPPSTLNAQGMMRVARTDRAATIGSAVHEMADAYVSDGCYDMKMTAGKFELSPEEVEECVTLLHYVVRAWEDVRRYFPAPQTETIVAADPFAVGGTDYIIRGVADVLSPIGDESAIILDWKSGRVDSGHTNQMIGLAYSAWDVMGSPDKSTISVVIVYLRHRYHRVLRFDANTLRSWYHDLAHNILPCVAYSPGAHCAFCEVAASCDARKECVGSMIDVLMHGQKTDLKHKKAFEKARSALSQLTAENKNDKGVGELVGQLMFRLRLASKTIEEARALLRDTVNRVGPIKLDDEIELSVRLVETRQLAPTKALPILRKHLSDTQICDGMKLSLPKLTAMYVKQHYGARRADAVKTLVDQLERAGAISTNIQSRLEEGPIHQEQVDESDSEHTGGCVEDAGGDGGAGKLGVKPKDG